MSVPGLNINNTRFQKFEEKILGLRWHPFRVVNTVLFSEYIKKMNLNIFYVSLNMYRIFVIAVWMRSRDHVTFVTYLICLSSDLLIQRKLDYFVNKILTFSSELFRTECHNSEYSSVVRSACGNFLYSQRKLSLFSQSLFTLNSREIMATSAPCWSARSYVALHRTVCQ